jgi:hypothetical protein
MGRVRYRLRQLLTISIGVVVVLALVFLAAFWLDTTMYNIDVRLPLWALIACWGLAVVDLVLQYLGLRHGETPRTVYKG